MSVHTAYIGTLAIERAFIAFGALCVANAPPVPDEIDVQRIDPLRRGHPVEEIMRLVSVDFRPD
ncbi:MAG TPA: hypothetical protein VKR06_45650 [Ktedonosporobacter sp.]|nr:hypothetical protein [Ktedonosporobacter sp.]